MSTMLNAIWVLSRAQLLIVRNTFWRGKIGRKIGLVVLLAFVGLLAFGLYSLMRAAVRFITSPAFTRALERIASEQPNLTIPTDIRPFLEALPSIALFAALIMLIFTSFSSVLSSLYLSGDIDTLLVAPVPMRAVFVVKFFGGLVIPYVLLFVLLGPALIGYGQGMGFGFAFFAAVVIVLGLLPLLPAGLGALLVMAVVRVIPARRARDIVGVLGGMLGALWYIGSQFVSQIAPRIAGVQTLNTLRHLDVPVLPSAWAGRALLAAGQGEWLTLFAYGGLFALLAISIFAACLLLAERLYYVGWSNIATQGGHVRRRRRINVDEQKTATTGSESFLARLLSFVLPDQVRAILYKDLRVFPRDLRNLQQLIFPLVLSGIWAYRLVTSPATPLGEGDHHVTQSFSTLGSAGISFFICLTISGVLGGPSISREGRSFWILKVAPISAWRLLIGKFVLAYLPFPLVGTLFVIALSILEHNTLSEFLFSIGFVLLVGLGTTSITLGLGAAFPRFNWENPQQQQTVRGGCLSVILYGVYIVVAIAVALGLPFLATFAPAWSMLINLLGWIVFAILTGLVVWGALSFGASRLERLEMS